VVRRLILSIPLGVVLGFAGAMVLGVPGSAEASAVDCKKACACQVSCEEKLATCNDKCKEKKEEGEVKKCRYACSQTLAKCLKRCGGGDCDCGGY